MDKLKHLLKEVQKSIYCRLPVFHNMRFGAWRRRKGGNYLCAGNHALCGRIPAGRSDGGFMGFAAADNL